MQLALVFASTLVLSAPAQAQEGSTRRLELSPRVRFVGTVVTPAGLPACGAVVESSAGGEAVAGADGGFELVADVPCEARWVDVTAAVTGERRSSLTALARVLPATFSPTTSAGTLVVAPGTSGRAHWQPTFGGLTGVSGSVHAMTVFDDGDGPALYVGGELYAAGGLEANRIARWDGRRWSAVGDGLTSTAISSVEALIVFDDGTGPALYAGGSFVTTGGGVPVPCIARWDGASWSSVGGGMDGAVRAFAVFDDGTGPALYAGGTFQTAGGAPASGVARWDGSSWSSVGSGTDSGVRAFAVFDDGTGPALYATGAFTTAGGVPANRIARWDGTNWSALGNGLDSGGLSLAVFDDGSGDALYVGGNFTTAGGAPATRIARWDGASWQALGSGANSSVLALCTFDAGDGAALYAGGLFGEAGGSPAVGIARWKDASWAAVGDGATFDLFMLYALAAVDLGDGPELHAGGNIWQVAGVPNDIARLDGAHWAALGRGPGGPVRALLSVDLGGTPQVYAAGHFAAMRGVPANNIALWNGSTWSALGSGTTDGPDLHSSTVYALVRYDDGGGADLYAGGDFEGAGGVSAKGIARWDGASWSAVGSGFHGYIRAFMVFDDGSGPALYQGAELVPASRWNGASWATITHGMNGAVYALAVFDDGTGPALYAGGAFTNASGGPVNHIARWTGSGWAALGSGTATTVRALAVFDDGSGPALYAAGDDAVSGGSPALCTRWDGTSWSSVGSGFGSRDVYALATVDDGTGPALYAAGSFFMADTVAARAIAKWDGASWSPLGAGLGPTGTPCYALAQFADDGGPALLAGGAFLTSHARDSFLAKWSVGKIPRPR